MHPGHDGIECRLSTHFKQTIEESNNILRTIQSICSGHAVYPYDESRTGCHPERTCKMKYLTCVLFMRKKMETLKNAALESVEKKNAYYEDRIDREYFHVAPVTTDAIRHWTDYAAINVHVACFTIVRTGLDTVCGTFRLFGSRTQQRWN
jgi:hypothetical protein